MRTILVTGGAGFIGSNFIRYMLNKDKNLTVINLDKLTYAGNLESIGDVMSDPRHFFVRGGIEDQSLVEYILLQYRPWAVINFAAESHVDRSIDSPVDFIQTNIVGTFRLLEAVRGYFDILLETEREQFRLLHVSTDEVYGSLGRNGYFSETTPYAPNSPYSATKASADHLVRAWYCTYGLPTLITNSSNNYGPYQFPEKLVPLMILNALDGKPLPLYGDGQNIRDWLYVYDNCSAIETVLRYGRVGEMYNIGSNNEKTNREVVQTICGILDELYPRPDGISYRNQIIYVQDRPGHDRRYAIDASKIKRELNWLPQENFSTGIKKTVEWYLANRAWCDRVTKGTYWRERLGLHKKKAFYY